MNRIEAVLDALHLEIKQRRGRRAWLLCAYHRDRAPTNFYVVLSGRTAGLNFCFSCKNGGSLYDLVMHVRGCDFDTAKAFIELLGKGYEPPKTRVRVVSRPPTLGRIRFKMPPEVLFEPLHKWVKPARDYATSRHITQAEVERFKIGYAIDGDKLSCRIVFPWIDRNRVVGGYSARSFVGQEPKYTTPSASEHPDPGIMFGEHTWDKKQIIAVTEGAINAIAVHQATPDVGLDIAALGGSEVNPRQAIKLSSFPAMIVLTDSDDAGDKAAQQLRSMLGRYTRSVRVKFPKKKDARDLPTPLLREKLLKALEELETMSHTTGT